MKITVTVTAQELLDKGRWSDYCDKYGINPYCINEGRMDSTDEVEISYEDAMNWGFIKTKN